MNYQKRSHIINAHFSPNPHDLNAPQLSFLPPQNPRFSLPFFRFKPIYLAALVAALFSGAVAGGQTVIVDSDYGGVDVYGNAKNPSNPTVWDTCDPDSDSACNHNPTYNTLILKAGAIVRQALGAYTAQLGGNRDAKDAIGNEVYVHTGATVTDGVYGAEARGLVDATGNKVYLEGGTVEGLIAGAYSSSANVSSALRDNHVFITGGTINSFYGVFGAHADSSFLSPVGNSVRIDESISTVSIDSAVIGASVSTGSPEDVVGNWVEMRAGRVTVGPPNSYCMSDGAILGGCTGGNGTARDNYVTLSGGTVIGDVLGAYAFFGLAQKNRVEITGGEITGDVYGGMVRAINSAEGNIVTLSSGKITGDVYGGYSEKSATGNSVTLSGGEIDGNVYGGYSKESATENIVNLYGGKITGGVFGGQFDNPSATGDFFTGNTLNIVNELPNAMARVTHFNIINFTYGHDGKAAIDVLDTSPTGDTANKPVELNTSEHTITFDGFITGSGGIKKTRAGILILTNDNDYEGDTFVSAGTLQLGNGGAAGSVGKSDVVLGDGSGDKEKALLVFNHGADILFDHEISGEGIVKKVSDNTLTFATENTYQGVTFIESGTLKLEGAGTIGSGDLVIYNGATFDITKADDNAALSSLTVYYQNYNAANLNPAQALGDLNLEGARLSFHIPATMGGDGVMTQVNGNALFEGATVSATIEGGSTALKATDKLILINASDSVSGTPLTKEIGIAQGSTLNFTYNVMTNETQLFLYKRNDINPVEKQAKALSEGAVAGVAFITDAGELAAHKGLIAAMEAADQKSIHAFGAVEGGVKKYETGSSVKIKGFSLLAGAVSKVSDAITLGGFIEYGGADAKTHNAVRHATYGNYDVDGEDDLTYYGLGLLGRYGDTIGGYVKGSVRVGRVLNDFSTHDFIVLGLPAHASYALKSLYLGAHIDGGYVIAPSATGTVDIYGRFLYTRQNGDTVKLSSGEGLNFKAVNSERLKLGVRYHHIAHQSVKPYIGVAGEYEFSGEARVKINDAFDVEAVKLRGSSLVGEIGVSISPLQNSFAFDLAATGYTGKRDGVIGTARVMYKW